MGYRCGRCHEWLPTMLDLRRHLFRKDCGSDNVDKTGVVIFPCYRCGVIFDTKENLELHQKCNTLAKPKLCDTIIEAAAGPDPPPPCAVCGERLISWVDYVHHTTEKLCEKYLKCPKCHEYIVRKRPELHEIRCRGSLKCEICGLRWTSFYDLRHHQKKAHGVQLLDGEITATVEKNEYRKPHTGTDFHYQCGRCHEWLPNMLELRRHLFHKECGSEKVDKLGVAIVPCDKCGVIFDTVKNLEQHQKRSFMIKSPTLFMSMECDKIIHAFAGPDPPRPCSVCGEKFISWVDYVHHTTDKLCEKYFKCPKCHEYIVHKRPELHVKLCQGSQKCEICGKRSDSLRVHLEGAHGLKVVDGEVTKMAKQNESPKPQDGLDLNYYCGRCHHSFPKLLEMRRHLFRKECGSENVDKLGVPIYPCIKCGMIFDNLENLERHRKRTFLLAATPCDKTIQAAAGSDPPPQCSLCKEIFYSWLDYVNHTTDKVCETGFKCPKCEKYIIGKDNKRHVARCTGSQKCEVCGSRWSRPADLVNHQGKAHGLEILHGEMTTKAAKKESPKPQDGIYLNYQCGRCHEWFPKLLEMRRHLFHKECGSENVDKLGVPIYPCNKCGVIFDTVKNLEQHQERTYLAKSSVCDKTILAAAGTDPPPQCSLCNETFSSWLEYVYHRNDKLCEAGLKCTICEKYIIGKNYKKHLTHCSGLRKCEICHEEFSAMCYLEQHKAYAHQLRILVGEVTIADPLKKNMTELLYHKESKTRRMKLRPDTIYVRRKTLACLAKKPKKIMEARFPCCRCLTAFSSKEEVRDHIREKHNIVVEDFIDKESYGAEENKYEMKGGCSVCHICGLVVMAVEFMCFHLRYCETLHGLPSPDDDE